MIIVLAFLVVIIFLIFLIVYEIAKEKDSTILRCLEIFLFIVSVFIGSSFFRTFKIGDKYWEYGKQKKLSNEYIQELEDEVYVNSYDDRICYYKTDGEIKDIDLKKYKVDFVYCDDNPRIEKYKLNNCKYVLVKGLPWVKTYSYIIYVNNESQTKLYK